ncbi:hypothetical protein F4802DRAFT_601237 [Xylaria palmicola]|nr:hypothetical protein F4802DRAFT_601237 [Xylaria palmicola]
MATLAPFIYKTSSKEQRTGPPSPYRVHRRQQSSPLPNSAMYASLAASPALAMTPPNSWEWKTAIREVKQKYLARKYRSCSMQCCDILESLGDTSAVEPLHLIYLHFYAASSFEWCARSLSSSSAYRTKLLESAQAHYVEIEALIAAKGWDMAERARSPSSVSTTSLGSPGLSAGSRTSGSNSSASSPRTSMFSLDDEPLVARVQPIRIKAKKKVSFSSLPEFFEFQAEPYVRPDSPTLGWDDHVSVPPLETSVPFPASPSRSGPTSIIKLSRGEKSGLTPAIAAIGQSGNGGRGTGPATADPAENKMAADQKNHRKRSSTPSNYMFDLGSFLQTRSQNRFREQLSALRDQVSRHRTSVDELLAASDNTPPTPSLISEPNMRPEPQQQRLSWAKGPLPSPDRHHLVDPGVGSEPARPALRLQTNLSSDVPGPRQHIRRYSSASASPRRAYGDVPATPKSAGSPALSAGCEGESLQNRIERLRASGWRRKRFDSRRYEALREGALCELGPYCCGLPLCNDPRKDVEAFF